MDKQHSKGQNATIKCINLCAIIHVSLYRIGEGSYAVKLDQYTCMSYAFVQAGAGTSRKQHVHAHSL